MNKSKADTIKCQICGKAKKADEVRPAALVNEAIVQIIKSKYPDWANDGYICITDLNKFREEYVKYVIDKSKGEVSVLEEDVIESLKKHDILSSNVNVEFENKLTLGERTADRMAKYAGSWHFISIFAAVLVVWILINTIILIQKPFDPYPFILLNLILSCIAAIQAPIIMMSQNRQESKDRLRSEYDYRVNLKAELEIRQLHEKIDHLLMIQWQRLLEIQQLQMELIEDLGLQKCGKK
jgi:uncharacterized membrane protein